MNDKFNCEQLHWAKEGLVAGAAVSWVKELASRTEEDIITVQEKPGCSAEAARISQASIHLVMSIILSCQATTVRKGRLMDRRCSTRKL